MLSCAGMAEQPVDEKLAAQTAREIRAEATLPNDSPLGYPLPLAASWNTGNSMGGYDPDYQIRMIQKGHHLLPWFQLNEPKAGFDAIKSIGYYRKPLIRCHELGLPISFISTQWESLLSNEPRYVRLPPAQNPNVIKPDGSVAPMVSPFGAVEPWQEAGREWTSTEVMKQFQFWDPDPPLVAFVSNNEHPKLTWREADSDQRYRASKSGYGSEDDRRKEFGQAWIERYRALQSGMRDGLSNDVWRNHSIFIGYDAFGTPAFGRWGGWIDYSLYSKNRIEPWPLAWDGASPSFYVNDWNPSTDYTVWSPQIESMNWVFMQDEAFRLNTSLWFEFSVWDGSQPGKPSDKRAFYARQGEAYTPERYAGMVKFGMWLLRPRVVREYRGWLETRKQTEPYFLALVKAVDEIHENPTLKNFWRKGSLVPNTRQEHPYQANIPAEYASKQRWFLLDTAIDPKRPWDLKTKIPVFSLCLTKGTAPKREWLVYVHSPLGSYKQIAITIPEYQDIKVDTSPAGTYYIVREGLKTPQPIAAAE